MASAQSDLLTVGDIWNLQPVITYYTKATGLSAATSMRVARYLQAVKKILSETEQLIVGLGAKYGERDGPAEFTVRDDREKLKYSIECAELLAVPAGPVGAGLPKIPAAALAPGGLPPQALMALYWAIEWDGWAPLTGKARRAVTYRQMYEADAAFGRLCLVQGLAPETALAVAAYFRACFPHTQELKRKLQELRAKFGEYLGDTGHFTVPPKGENAIGYHEAVARTMDAPAEIPDLPRIPAASLASAELTPGMLAVLSEFMISDLSAEEEAAAEAAEGAARRAAQEASQQRLAELEKGRGGDAAKIQRGSGEEA